MRIVHVLRKPLGEASVAANVLRHGTGALNIRACRISTKGNLNRREEAGEYMQSEGRWPANVLLEHHPRCRRVLSCVEGCPVADLDSQSADSHSCRSKTFHQGYDGTSATSFVRGHSHPDNQYDDAGGASRFFKRIGGHR